MDKASVLPVRGAVNAHERHVQALRMAERGKSQTEIAKLLGYHDASGARKAIYAAMGQEKHPNAAILFEMELRRYDILQEAVWDKASTPPTAGEDAKMFAAEVTLHLGAVNAALKIMAQRAKMTGLDQHETDSVPKEEVHRLMDLLTTTLQAYVPYERWPECKAAMQAARSPLGRRHKVIDVESTQLPSDHAAHSEPPADAPRREPDPLTR